MEGNITEIIDILRGGGCIIANKSLVRLLGLDAAIMFSELVSKAIYFNNKNQLTDDGYFFNTVENMQLDTSLTDYKQRKAIKKLIKLKYIREELRGLPSKRYFKVIINNNDLKEILITEKKQQSLKYSITTSEEIKESGLNKVQGNNTNINDTNCNDANKKNKGDLLETVNSPEGYKENLSETVNASSGNKGTIFFAEFSKRLNESEEKDAVEYYLRRYREIFRREHHKLLPETWNNVINTLLHIDDDYFDSDVAGVCIEGIMERYFSKKYQEGCDYSITHFNNSDIKRINFYEERRERDW